jgi:DNA excision repair protein ERCC-4
MVARPPAASTKICPSSRDDRIAVVVDTREQLPWTFDPALFRTVQRALPAGDYSLEGHESSIAIERKSLDDYVASVITGRERFGRELNKLADLELGCVVVEATLEDVLAHRYRSSAHPNAVFGATTSIIVDRRVPVFFCSDRQIARRFVEGVLRRYALATRSPDS